MNAQITGTLKLFVVGDLNFTERALTLVSRLRCAHALEAAGAHKFYWMQYAGKQAFFPVIVRARFSTPTACSIS